MLVPVFWSVGYLFIRGNAITGFHFIGLADITHLFPDPIGSALGSPSSTRSSSPSARWSSAICLALLYVFVLKRSSAMVRTLVFFPMVLPTVAVAELFQKLFAIAPQYGLVNALLHAVGLTPVDWFGSAGTAFLVLVIMDIWRSMGFYARAPVRRPRGHSQTTSSRRRGSTAPLLRLIRRIIVPLSLPVLLSSFIFSINGTLKVFDSVLALTNGGPGTSTTPLTLYMFNTSFTYGDYGYGAPSPPCYLCSASWPRSSSSFRLGVTCERPRSCPPVLQLLRCPGSGHEYTRNRHATGYVT